MNRLKELRASKGQSIRDMAKSSGIGSATITRLENGGKAYFSTLYRLAQYFEVDIRELLEFEAINPKSDRLPLVEQKAA